MSDPVVLDVGGTKFSCSIERLLQIPDTYFTALLSGRWELKVQKDGSLFIDRDPTVFSLIMTYLRSRGDEFNVIEWLSNLSVRKRALLKQEAKFFGFSELLIPEDGHILKKSHWEAVHPDSHKRQLVFDLNKDGDSLGLLESRLRNRSQVLLVIRLPNAAIVGGFTPIAWDFTRRSQSSGDAYLFSMLRKGGLVKHPLKKGRDSDAFGISPSEKLIFGTTDLRVSLRDATCMTLPDAFDELPQAIQDSGKYQTIADLEIWTLD